MCFAREFSKTIAFEVFVSEVFDVTSLILFNPKTVQDVTSPEFLLFQLFYKYDAEYDQSKLVIHILAFSIVRKRSLQRLCFYTCMSFCSQGWGVPRIIPRGEVGGLVSWVSRQSARGRGCPGLGGVSRPRPRGVSQHALRQPPSRRLLLRTVRILL